MVKVNCNDKTCKNNKNGRCSSEEIRIYTGKNCYDWCFVECKTYIDKTK